MEYTDGSKPGFLRRLVGLPQSPRGAGLPSTHSGECARLQAALDVSGTGTFRWDVRADVMEWDANLARLFDCELELAPHDVQSFFELVHPLDRARLEGAIQDLLRYPETARELDVEMRVALADGRVRWLKARAQMFLGTDGLPQQLLGALSDVTSFKEAVQHAEQARELAERGNAAKSNFLANMSHEIRTPLTAILGFADLLGEVSLTEACRRDFAAAIRRNGDHLLDLVNEILDLARVEAGLLRIELRPFRLRDALKEVVNVLQPRAQAKGLALRLDVAASVPEVLEGDALRLRQIVSNLADNALKFTDQGEVAILVGWTAPAHLEIVVRDTGAGVPVECRDMIFQPFVQAEASAARGQGGSGLGLAIARKLAQALRGDLELRESVVGQGSVFALTVGFREPRPPSSST